MKHLKKVCLFCLLLLMVFTSGCGAEESVDENEAQDQTPVGEQEAVPLSVGQRGTTDNFEISITRVEKAAEWINGPKEGREYVVVSFSVTNISDEEQSVGASDFQFVGEDGYRESYAATTGVKAQPEIFGATDLAAGESFQGSLVYAIPVSMSTVELHFIERMGAEPLRFEFSK